MMGVIFWILVGLLALAVLGCIWDSPWWIEEHTSDDDPIG